jgi:1,2-dihydroxy-3-keto-5-methylthiopentene dioxygenase
MAVVTEKETGRLYEGAEASRVLESVGVHYEYWDVTGLDAAVRTRYDLTKEEQEAAILGHFQAELDRISEERGYVIRDLIVLSPKTENIEQMLVNFVKVHHHTEDEVRFIVDGEGIFTVLRHDAWYDIVVRPGDLIAVPAGTRHWFTLTDLRHVKAVRLFQDPNGWVAIYEESKEASA